MSLLRSALLALCLSAPVLADEPAPPNTPAPAPALEGEKRAKHPKRDRRREGLLKRFDTDKDGKLSDAERAAAKEAMKGKLKEKKGAVKEKLLKKFDADGDGKLNDAEREAAKKALEERRAQKGKRPKKDKGGKREKPAEKPPETTPKQPV